MDLDQSPRAYSPPGNNPSYSTYYDPNEDSSYRFDFSTSQYQRTEQGGPRGQVDGSYSYIDDAGETHNVQFEAGSQTGFHVKTAYPDSNHNYNDVFFNGDGKVPLRGRTSIQREPDGSYKFITHSHDQRRSETKDAIGNTRGSYTYIDKDGVQRTVQYIAGPNIGYKIVNSGQPTRVRPYFPYGYQNPSTFQNPSGYKPSSVKPPAVSTTPPLFIENTPEKETPPMKGFKPGQFPTQTTTTAFPNTLQTPNSQRNPGSYNNIGGSDSSSDSDKTPENNANASDGSGTSSNPGSTNPYLCPVPDKDSGTKLPGHGDQTPYPPHQKPSTEFLDSPFNSLDNKHSSSNQPPNEHNLFTPSLNLPSNAGFPEEDPDSPKPFQNPSFKPFVFEDNWFLQKPFSSLPPATSSSNLYREDLRKDASFAGEAKYLTDRLENEGAFSEDNFRGFPPGVSVKGRVQSIDIYPFGTKVPAPGEALEGYQHYINKKS